MIQLGKTTTPNPRFITNSTGSSWGPKVAVSKRSVMGNMGRRCSMKFSRAEGFLSGEPMSAFTARRNIEEMFLFQGFSSWFFLTGFLVFPWKKSLRWWIWGKLLAQIRHRQFEDPSISSSETVYNHHLPNENLKTNLMKFNYPLVI